MEAVIEWYEDYEHDHSLDLDGWAELLLTLDPSEYVGRAEPRPTNVLPTLPTVEEYRRYGDRAMTPRGYVMRFRHRQGLGLWHPNDARWTDSDVCSCLGPLITAYHRKDDHGGTGCKYFAHAGFATFGPLTCKAKACLQATEALAKSIARHSGPEDKPALRS
jgi:hypothetical protein